VVVVLGPVGRSFGAGMTGGSAFVLDRRGTLDGFLDPEMVRAEPLTAAEDCALLLRLIRRHEAETGSGLAHRLLAGWERTVAAFRRVVPADDGAANDAGQAAATHPERGLRGVRTEPWMPRSLAALGR
jgi:glutamate synthase domain-containing protein 3